MLRRFADIFASCNKTVYDEVIKFERYFVRSIIQNWKEWNTKINDLISRRHSSWADMLGHFDDVKAGMDSEKGYPRPMLIDLGMSDSGQNIHEILPRRYCFVIGTSVGLSGDPFAETVC